MCQQWMCMVGYIFHFECSRVKSYINVMDGQKYLALWFVIAYSKGQLSHPNIKQMNYEKQEIFALNP